MRGTQVRNVRFGKGKPDRSHDTTYARGGKGKMFGPQAAGPDRPGNTGKDQSPAPGAKAARGGPKVHVGGLSRPASPGRTGPR